MFTALSVTKVVVAGLVGIGTTKIVTQIIKNNVSADNALDKVSMAVAAWSIGGVAAKVTKKYTEDTIDEIAKGVTTVVEKAKHATKLGRINREESTFEKEGLDAGDYHKNPETNKWTKNESDPEVLDEEAKLVDLKKTLDNSGLRGYRIEIDDDGDYDVIKSASQG